MMSSSHASISSSVILAAVAMVGAVAFAAGRESLSSSPVSSFAICSAATEAAFPAETPYLRESDAAMARMMAGMVIKPTGDVDRDFVALMTSHHQGAIEMAEAVLRSGRNEQIRRLAQEIIVTQQQEIVAMRLAVGEAPPAASPTHISVSSSPVLTRAQKAGEPP